MLTLLLLYLRSLCQSCCVSRKQDAMNEIHLNYFKMHRLFALILESVFSSLILQLKACIDIFASQINCEGEKKCNSHI